MMENEQIVKLIKQHCPSVKLIYLFGSRALNQHTVKSDWDIAVLNDAKIAPLERWQLSELLASECNNNVDLVDLLEASTVLKMQIVDKGKLLFDQNNFASSFEIQTMGMYGNLQESRKEIVDNFVTNVKEQDKRKR